jgi:CheY-like chemotaxis protein
MHRVVIVDDDEVSRRGLAGLLADHPNIEIVGALTHESATAWSTEWDQVDVAIVDAADERRGDDHFPGVAVVQALRRCRQPEETVVIVVTGHFFDDALRRRMREAAADFFYHRSELQSAEALYAAVLNPEKARVGVPDPEDPEVMFRHGVVDATRVNEAVAFLRREGPGPAEAGPRSRRWLAYRRSFNDAARLNPVNADGTVPDREQHDPSLPQIQRFWEWATRSKQRHL